MRKFNPILVLIILVLPIGRILAQGPDSLPESFTEGVLEFESQENKPIENEDVDPFTQDVAPEIVDSQDLRAEFIQYTQDPATKNVKFEIILTSNITSERVLLEWFVSGISVPKKGQELKGILSVKKGDVLRLPLEVKPTGYGLSEVFARIQVTNIDNESLVTVRKNFASNEKGEILPITPDYKQKQTEMTILNIVFLSIGLTVLLIGSFFGLKFFIKWLDKEESDYPKDSAQIKPEI